MQKTVFLLLAFTPDNKPVSQPTLLLCRLLNHWYCYLASCSIWLKCGLIGSCSWSLILQAALQSFYGKSPFKKFQQTDFSITCVHSWQQASLTSNTSTSQASESLVLLSGFMFSLAEMWIGSCSWSLILRAALQSFYSKSPFKKFQQTDFQLLAFALGRSHSQHFYFAGFWITGTVIWLHVLFGWNVDWFLLLVSHLTSSSPII